jgi:predicted DNA-binding transcriptional regulator YafY
MSRSERLLEILITLQTKPRFTVQELADEFAVSRRTMLRDLHALSAMGVPLAATPGPYGGYSLIAHRRLFPLSLSADEAIGIVLSYEALLQYADSPFAAQSLSAITKVRSALPPDVVREMDLVREHIAVTAPRVQYQAPHLPALLTAAVDAVHLHITYDSQRRTSQRVVFPYGIFAAQGFWYVLCHDQQRDSRVMLRADRVRALERVEGLEPPVALTLRDWLDDYAGETPELVSIRARITRRAAMSVEINTLFGEIAIGEDGTGILESAIPHADIDYFAQRFLALGTDVVVESPPELIEAIRTRARAVAALYGGSGD